MIKQQQDTHKVVAATHDFVHAGSIPGPNLASAASVKFACEDE